MKKILFVCLGNICRSPAAEAVYKHYIAQLPEKQQVFIDSAGTSAFHEGEKADARMREHSLKRGIEITSISRGTKPSDFEDFDLIVTMDNSNFNILSNRIVNQDHKKKIVPFCQFLSSRSEKEVPDPYYGGEESFERVLDILEDGVENLHKYLLTT